MAQRVQGYNKAVDYSEKLIPRQQEALDRAERRMKGLKTRGQALNRVGGNPYTTVCRLVQHLNERINP